MFQACRTAANHVAPRPDTLTASAGAAATQFWRLRSSCWRRCRGFSSTSPILSDGARPPHIVAKSEADAEVVRFALQRLLASASPPLPHERAGRWSLTANGDGVERPFKFKNFTKTWDFMTAVALQCKLKNHHPEWSNVYNTTFIRWTTHSPVPGLTHKDVELAALCDELGRAFGEVADQDTTSVGAAQSTEVRSSSESPTCSLQSLANNAAGISGGDCCAPKPTKNS